MAEEYPDDDDYQVNPKYEDILDSSKTRDFEKILQQGSFKHIGVDEQQRPIFVCVPTLIGKTPEDVNLFIEYVVSVMDPLVVREYVVILCNSLSTILNPNLITIVKNLYDCLPRNYKKNLKAVNVLHADASLKLFLSALSKFVSPKVWAKVRMIDHLRDVSVANINRQDFQKLFPYVVHRYDCELMKAAGRLGTRQLPSHFGIPITTQVSSAWTPIDSVTKERCLPKAILDMFGYLAKPEVVRIRDIFMCRPLENPNDLYVLIEDLDSGVSFIEFDPPDAVATLMKLFLDSLPEPLLGMDVIQSFLQSTNLKAIVKKWSEITEQINVEDAKPGDDKNESLLQKLLQERIATEQLRDEQIESFLQSRLPRLVLPHKALIDRVAALLTRSANQMALKMVTPNEQEKEYSRVIDAYSKLYAPAFCRPARFDVGGGVKSQLAMGTGEALLLHLLLARGAESLGGVAVSVHQRFKLTGSFNAKGSGKRNLNNNELAGLSISAASKNAHDSIAKILGEDAARATGLADEIDPDIQRNIDEALAIAKAERERENTNVNGMEKPKKSKNRKE